MQFKTLLAGLILCITSTVFAADKPILKDSVDAEVKTAIEAAQAANQAAKIAGVEWVWAKPVRKMWTGKRQTSTKIIRQAIEMANDGQNADAKKLAAYIENAAKQGLLQAERAKKAGPANYGI